MPQQIGREAEADAAIASAKDEEILASYVVTTTQLENVSTLVKAEQVDDAI